MKDFKNYHRWDVGTIVGVGLWMSNINLNFSYQTGFVGMVPQRFFYTSNYIVSLGSSF